MFFPAKLHIIYNISKLSKIKSAEASEPRRLPLRYYLLPLKRERDYLPFFVPNGLGSDSLDVYVVSI